MEETGVKEIDTALDAFVAWNPSFEEPVDEDDEDADWDDLFAGTLADLRLSPEDTTGLCTQVTCELVDFLLERELDAVSSEELDSALPGHPFSGLTAHTADAFGYQDRAHDSFFPYHAATVVRDSSGLYLIDFTAGQYGYTEFPLIQRWDEAAKRWQREW
jgi:hypothetical protein